MKGIDTNLFIQAVFACSVMKSTEKKKLERLLTESMNGLVFSRARSLFHLCGAGAAFVFPFIPFCAAIRYTNGDNSYGNFSKEILIAAGAASAALLCTDLYRKTVHYFMGELNESVSKGNRYYSEVKEYKHKLNELKQKRRGE